METTQGPERGDRQAWQQLMGLEQAQPADAKGGFLSGLVRRFWGGPALPASDPAAIQRVVGRAHGAWDSIATEDAAATAHRLFTRSVKSADGG